MNKIFNLFRRKSKSKESDVSKVEKQSNLSIEERQRIAEIRINKFKPDPIQVKINNEHKKRDLEYKKEINEKINPKNRSPNITAEDWLKD